MGKLEKKIVIIKTYLPRCNAVYDCYTFGNIPKEKFYNACRSYAGQVEYNKALGLIDETVFGSAKKGMLFTESGVYASGISHIMKYADGASFSSLPSSYNLVEVNELLDKLNEVENALTGWDIAGSLLGAVFNGVVSALEESANSAITQEESLIGIEDHENIVDVNEIDEDEVDIDDMDDDTLKQEIFSAQMWVESVQTVMSNMLLCDEDDCLNCMGDILSLFEHSEGQERFINQLLEYLTEDDSEEIDYDMELMRFERNSRKIVNKTKYYISILKDADDNEEIEEELLEAKEVYGNYLDIVNDVSDIFEAIIEEITE